MEWFAGGSEKSMSAGPKPRCLAGALSRSRPWSASGLAGRAILSL